MEKYVAQCVRSLGTVNTRSRGFRTTKSMPRLFVGGGGGGVRSWQAGEARSVSKRHSRNLSESRITAVRCYDCPTNNVVADMTRSADTLILVPGNAVELPRLWASQCAPSEQERLKAELKQRCAMHRDFFFGPCPGQLACIQYWHHKIHGSHTKSFLVLDFRSVRPMPTGMNARKCRGTTLQSSVSEA